MQAFINHNGKLQKTGEPVIEPEDHSYRYGDGLFETMKIVNGKIVLGDYHFTRLFSGMKLLKMNIPPSFTPESLRNEIAGLINKNNCEELARVRISVSRGKGGLYDCNNQLNYIIECQPLEKLIHKLNENGLIIGIYKGAQKSCDDFSNLKSANYLPYVMAAIWARENKMDDALILNQHHRICDATIANIFWIKNEIVFTPPLSEGPVAGVMRNYLLKTIPGLGIKIKEEPVTAEELLKADEIFLTNAVSDIRWVRQFGNKFFVNTISQKLYNTVIKTLH